MGFIYIAINEANGKAYIGQTIQTMSRRLGTHKHQSTVKNPDYFHRAIKKHGWSGFTWNVLEELPNNELDTAESFWIQYYKYIGAQLYNLNPGGLQRGVLSKEGRARISASSKNNKHALGHKHDKEALDKIIKASIGNQYNKGKPNRQKLYDVKVISPDGIVFGPILNASEFARKHNLSQGHFSAVLRGDRPIHLGWRLYKE